ncbi:MAG: trigger factor [Cytophagales bacterium]|nr:trigger factor [Cytophagales bacterium]
MDIRLDKSTATSAVLKVTVTTEDYQAGVDKRAKDYSKKANIKGFRPGKVPMGMIKRMYGQSLLVEEINELLGQSVNNYIRENEVQIIGEPLPMPAENIDWKEGNTFEFSYELGLVGDFTLNLDQNIEGYEVEVGDEDINTSIEDLKAQLGERTNPEEAGEEDMIFGDLTIEGEEKPVKAMVEIADLATKTGKSIFIGLKKDEEKTFDIRKAYRSNEKVAKFLNRPEEEVKDLNGEVTLKVISINGKVEAELNQEFFDKVVGKDIVSNEEEFRAKLKEILEGNYKNQISNLVDGKLREALVANTEIEIPEEFFKKWLLASQKDLTEEKVTADWDKYTEELKWMQITDRIASENNIDVTAEEIKATAETTLRNQLMMYGLPTDQLDDNMADFVENYLKGENGQNYMNTYHQVRMGKVFDIVKEKINLETKKVSVEEFKKIVQA